MIYALPVYPVESSEKNALLLVESIRSSAGSLSKNPIWCIVPKYDKQLSKGFTKKISLFDVDIFFYAIDKALLEFPFAPMVMSAAETESRALGQTEILVWLDTNTVILKEPKDFFLADHISLGYRPAHHRLIGSPSAEPPDDFWKHIYNYCGVPEKNMFSMMTHVDGKKIRPYFNAGILITRPGKKIFQSWKDMFFAIYQEAVFKEFYKTDDRYAIFMHQAVLSGVILASLSPDELQELPPTYNYPVHLYNEDITQNKQKNLKALVTFRYE
jgi:hypothetical protein